MITIDNIELPDDTDIAQLNAKISYVVNFYRQKTDSLINLTKVLLNEIDTLKNDCHDAYHVIDYLTDKIGVQDGNKTRPLENLQAAQEGDPRPYSDILPYPQIIKGVVNKL